MDGGAGQAADDNLPYLLLPLKEDVVFPGMTIVLPVLGPELAGMIEETLPKSRKVVVSTLKSNVQEPVGPESFYAVGVVGRVVQMMRRGDTPVLVFEAPETEAEATIAAYREEA